MKKITNITIVGGGTAGFMTATTLLNQFPDKKITLVESPNISTVGVGESTIPGINQWLSLVDIDYADFMPHCDATFKLSIGYEDWYRKDSGQNFHAPFGPLDLSQHDFGPPGKQEYYDDFTVRLNDWHLKRIFYPETPVREYTEWFLPSMALINQNKSFMMSGSNWFAAEEFRDHAAGNQGIHMDPRGNHDCVAFNNMDHAYQFDATKFGLWLRDNYCKARYSNNFTHILANVKDMPLNEDGIEHLILDDGRKLNADLFIDCTGFKSLLLTETFGVSFEKFEDYIPNNYAWATKMPYKDPETQIVQYTNCTAVGNGWIWEIPLFSRMGTGYVFSDKFISVEDAQKEFKQELIKKGYENVEDLEYALIPMRCGVQEKLWVKNTCAMGLAAGFIEPLQSTGLTSVHIFIFNLCRALDRGYINEWDRREFTQKCHDDIKSLTSIVAITYALSHRDDTEYWRDLQNREWPEDIFKGTTQGLSKYMRELYYNKNFDQDNHLIRFGNDTVPLMLVGMNWNPIDNASLKYRAPLDFYNNLKNTVDANNMASPRSRMEKRKIRWNEYVKGRPSPYQYLKDTIHNDK